LNTLLRSRAVPGEVVREPKGHASQKNWLLSS